MKTQDSLIQDVWVRLRAELLADKKKSAVMGALFAIALLLGLKVVAGGTSPSAAEAAGSAPAASAPSEMAVVAASPKATHSRLAAYLEKIDTTVPRDLFATDYGVYPMADLKPIQPGPLSASDDAAVLAQRRRREFAHSLAKKLTLQGTMPGDPPTAIINGYVVRQGQQFMGFVVRDIQFGSCIVAHGTIEVTLTME